MTLNDRDRKILLGLIPLVVVGIYWFLLLAPKREEAVVAAAALATEQDRLTFAQSKSSTLAAAKKNFAADYAAVVRLGKAVPASVDMPSLLLQLERAAAGTGISIETVTTGPRLPLADSPSPAASAMTPAAPDPAAAAPPPGGAPPAGGAPPTAPSGAPAQSGPGAAAGQAQAAADAANGANGAAVPGTPAPAAGGALEVVTLDFGFKGSFFEMASFFHKLKRFVYVQGDQVRVRGRLMTIDKVAYQTDPRSFPNLTAEVSASVFLSPKDQGAAAGATPAGPAPGMPAAPAPTTSTASTGGSAPPAPTAAAAP